MNMNTQYTPGPWTIAAESGEWFPTLKDYSPIPATEANARLIASAPDLLAALAECLDSMERVGPPPITQGHHCEEQDWNAALRSARSALAKASPPQVHET